MRIDLRFKKIQLGLCLFLCYLRHSLLQFGIVQHQLHGRAGSDEEKMRNYIIVDPCLEIVRKPILQRFVEYLCQYTHLNDAAGHDHQHKNDGKPDISFPIEQPGNQYIIGEINHDYQVEQLNNCDLERFDCIGIILIAQKIPNPENEDPEGNVVQFVPEEPVRCLPYAN